MPVGRPRTACLSAHGYGTAPALWACAALLVLRASSPQAAGARFGQRKRRREVAFAPPQTKDYPSVAPTVDSLPGSLIAKHGRKMRCPIMSTGRPELYENAKSHAMDMIFLPRGMSRCERGLPARPRPFCCQRRSVGRSLFSLTRRRLIVHADSSGSLRLLCRSIPATGDVT